MPFVKNGEVERDASGHVTLAERAAMPREQL